MTLPQSLLNGYQAFLKKQYAPLRDRYQSFAQGQNPDHLVIACADSRVDPSMIFNAGPGELFVLRNVAALVPPYEIGGGLHGVSAGIEFAVTVLGVSNVMILGHGLCGGINACLHAEDGEPAGEFIAPWVELAASARQAVNTELPNGSDDERQRLGEYKGIELSLQNLMTFPFVRSRVEQGSLDLHGVWYSVYEGDLRWRNPDTGSFDLVDQG